MIGQYVVESNQESGMLKPGLTELGWSNYFIQQLSLEEWDNYTPARIIEQHRSELIVSIEQDSFAIATPAQLDSPLVVGDWILLDSNRIFYRLLERVSIFKRKAAGAQAKTQLIAANVDTLFIVSSMNNDFNLNRIERYLVLANDAGVEPVVVLTKADLCDDETEQNFISTAQSLDPYLMIVSVNALDQQALSQFSNWCRPGKTLALLGSSGVGKSTLANLLVGEDALLTGGIREDDSKGRHTTTARSLHLIPKSDELAGGLLLDTPGMRELQLTDVEEGIEETFQDVMAFAERCKFADCTHESNLPASSGCAVQAAIESGELQARRLISFQKLQREDAMNSATLAERREKDKQFGKMVRSVMGESKKFKGR